MRFITEFEIMEYEKDKYHIADTRRSYYERKLSPMIVTAFGWQNPVNNNPLHHRLEIEAFPMDKWIEFKKRFADALPDYDSTSRTRLINALSDLESFITKKPG